MRKLLSTILFALLCCYAMAYDFSAVCSTGQTLYYNITSDVEPYTVEVTSETSSSPYYTTRPVGELEIPETVEYNSITYSVTSIGELAFYNCYDLTSLTIGNSVESIGRSAFSSCSSLTGALTIPESVTSIGESAFAECIGLTSVTLPNSVENIDNDVLFGCSGLTEPVYNTHCFVYFPNGYASEYTIPDGIPKIGGGAFRGCTSLTNITIPEYVTIIGIVAFESCEGLTSVTIPNSVTSIGDMAFSGCSGLTTVNFNATNSTSGSNLFYECPSLSTLNIGENVTNIPDNAFSDCSGLTEVTIPNAVTSIGNGAFSSCSGINTINFNATNCSSGDYPFYNCEAVATLNIGENVTIIPPYAFVGATISNINAYPYTPPDTGGSPFEEGVYSTANVYTPCGAVNSYRNWFIWRQFANIHGDTTVNFSITVHTENETMGSVTGDGGNYSCEEETTITATPATGYRFLQWNDGNTDNPRTVVVTADSTFTAGFKAIYTVIVQSNNESYGSVSGSGTYDEGSTATISATPYQGYRFVQWDDNNTDNPRTITVTEDITFTAIFEEVPSYTITILSSNEAYGSVSGSGTYYDGDTVAILAMPNAGYNFVSWNDGDESSPRTIVVKSDSTFIADFEKCEITYAIDTVVNNFVTVGDHTFYSTGNYTFAVSHETACDTIFDIHLRVLAELVYDIGPNPTKSLLNIKSDGFISAVEFYTITGQFVMRKEVNGYEAEFDVEGLMDGVYILRIYGEESSLPSVTKIIKE